MPFTAVGCAVGWLAERWPDPHNCERDNDEDRDHNFAPHGATVATADVPMVTAMWQFGRRLPSLPFDASPDRPRNAGHATRTYMGEQARLGFEAGRDPAVQIGGPVDARASGAKGRPTLGL